MYQPINHRFKPSKIDNTPTTSKYTIQPTKNINNCFNLALIHVKLETYNFFRQNFVANVTID
jgi:hypothetical protein